MGDFPPVASAVVEDACPGAREPHDRLGEPPNLVPVGVHPDDRPLSGVVDPQEGVSRQEDPVGAADLARSLALPYDRSEVSPAGVEYADLRGLLVQHVDGAVAGCLNPNGAEGEVGVRPIRAAELEIDMRFGDFGPDRIDGGEAGIAYEHRPVGQRLAGRVACRRFGFAGGEGGDQGESDEDGRRGGGVCESWAEHGAGLRARGLLTADEWLRAA